MKIHLSFFLCLFMAVGAWGQQPIGAATAEELAEQLAPPVALTRTLRVVAPAARKLDLSIQFISFITSIIASDMFFIISVL